MALTNPIINFRGVISSWRLLFLVFFPFYLLKIATAEKKTDKQVYSIYLERELTDKNNDKINMGGMFHLFLVVVHYL